MATIQTRFKVEKKVELLPREVPVACYILEKVKTGDTLRSISVKLPIRTSFENIKQILIKLQKLGWITMEYSMKGKKIKSVSKKAEDIAEYTLSK